MPDQPTVTQEPKGLVSKHFDLDVLFDYHRPDAEQQERMEWLRERFKHLAVEVVRRTVPGPEQTLAVRKLVDAQQQAIAAIAREPYKPRSTPASYEE